MPEAPYQALADRGFKEAVLFVKFLPHKSTPSQFLSCRSRSQGEKNTGRQCCRSQIDIGQYWLSHHNGIEKQRQHADSEGKDKGEQQQEWLHFSRKAPLHQSCPCLIGSEMLPPSQKQIGRRPCDKVSDNPHDDGRRMKDKACRACHKNNKHPDNYRQAIGLILLFINSHVNPCGKKFTNNFLFSRICICKRLNLL